MRHWNAISWYASLWTRGGLTQGAAQAAALAPENPKPHLFACVCFIFLGKRKDAIKSCRRALSMNPNDPETLHKCVQTKEVRKRMHLPYTRAFGTPTRVMHQLT